jgi:hypothetical protein
VALNGSSFVALKDRPGDCPGDGWQLLASAGKRGERGLRGPIGDTGPAAPRCRAVRAQQALERGSDGIGFRTIAKCFSINIP